jgi:hypothetical protein
MALMMRNKTVAPTAAPIPNGTPPYDDPIIYAKTSTTISKI